MVRMVTGPSPYDASMIRLLRPPEVEGAEGDWHSRWVLRMAAEPTQAALSSVATALSAGEGEGVVELTSLGASRVRLELRSAHRPLEREAFPLVDRVLRGIDEALGGIAEINDSPRDWWRTFWPATGPGAG